MLVLKRRDGDWIEIIHAKTGDVLRMRTYDIQPGHPGKLNIAFDDDDRNFEIARPERKVGQEASAKHWKKVDIGLPTG